MFVRIVKMSFKPDKVDEFLSNFENSKTKIRTFKGCSLWLQFNIAVKENVKNPKT